MTRHDYRAAMLALAERNARLSLESRQRFDLIALGGLFGAMVVTAFCFSAGLPAHSSAMIPAIAFSFVCHRVGCRWQRRFLERRQELLDEMEENLRQ